LRRAEPKSRWRPDEIERDGFEKIPLYFSSVITEFASLVAYLGSEPTLNHQATIIIPLRAQRDDFLAACLDSAVRQTSRCQILVVTSEATPRSNLDVVARFQETFANVTALPQLRPSFAAAINTGIGAAQASRVGLLLSDDWLSERAVER